MIMSEQDITLYIAQEARRYFPELFEDKPAPPPSYREAKEISTPWNGFEARLKYDIEESSPLPRALQARDIALLRSEFPILQEKVNGHPLVWFDNAATTQKPCCVIDRLADFYRHENSNIHRAAHTLARAATSSYEDARRQAAGLIGAPSPDAIVFVRGATEAINLVAGAYGPTAVTHGDEILVSELEHHANIVPWQLLCRKTGAALQCIPVTDNGQIDMSAYRRLLSPRTKIVAVAQVSNVLGSVAPVEEMTALAHRAGAVILVDGAQAVSHMPVNVTAIGCDFYVFSSHKMFGPTGIGVLYGKASVLEAMPPYQGGGNMIDAVSFEESRFKHPPHRFEAGTGSIADAVGLGQAAAYIRKIGLDRICLYEHALVAKAMDALHDIPGLTIIGRGADSSGIISFDVSGLDSEWIAGRLDREGIAVRAGHHCAQPILQRFGLEKVVRASFAVYNTPDELDRFAGVLRHIIGSPLYFPAIS